MENREGIQSYGHFLHLLYSLPAMKFGPSPWHKYSSHREALPQSFLSRRMSSVKVDPEAPMNTLDMAQIVLSSIASTLNWEN